MTITLSEHLINFPFPDVSSHFEIQSYFKADENYDFVFNLEKIIRKQSTLNINYELDLEDYIRFSDFYELTLEEGLHECIIEIEKDGVRKLLRGDFIGGLQVDFYPDYISISCIFVIKEDIII